MKHELRLSLGLGWALLFGACSGSNSNGLGRDLDSARRDAAAERDADDASNTEPSELDAGSPVQPEDADSAQPDAAAPEDAALDAASSLDAADARAEDAAEMDASEAAAPADAGSGDATLGADAGPDATQDAERGDAACPYTPCVDPALLGGSVYFSALAADGGVDGKIWRLNPGLSQVTTGAWPRVSPDSRYMLFHRGQAAPSRTYVYRRDLTSAEEITFFSHSDYAVAYDFSNDGTQVYFDYYCEIYRANADGRSASLLHSGGCFADAPSVNRVNGDIVYHSDDGLHLMTNQAQNVRLVSNSVPGDYWPSWSHDGAQLLFCRTSNVTSCAYQRILPDGQGLRLLGTTGPLASSSGPSGPARAILTPDDTRLLAPGVVQCLPALHVFRADGSGYEGPVCGTEGLKVDFVGDVLP